MSRSLRWRFVFFILLHQKPPAFLQTVLMLLFMCFIRLCVARQNTHIIAAAIQNTVDINIFSRNPVEYKVVSAYSCHSRIRVS